MDVCALILALEVAVSENSQPKREILGLVFQSWISNNSQSTFFLSFEN